MIDKPSTCSGCPARTVGRGYVPGSGPKGAKLVFVGQGPGEVEAHAGKPFVGPSGERLGKWLAKAGLTRHLCRFDNVIRCWLPKNRPGTRAEMEHCTRVHLLPELRDNPHLRVVVPVGIPAARCLLGDGFTEKSAGCIKEFDLGTGRPRDGLDPLQPSSLHVGGEGQDLPELCEGSDEGVDVLLGLHGEAGHED